MLYFNKDSKLKLNTLERAVEQSSVTILITDKKGNIEYINKAFREITGYNSKEVIGKNVRILKSGYHSKDFYKEMWETILSGKTWKGELYNKRKNGEQYWESTVISPVFDKKGRIFQFVCTKEDITEKKKFEKTILDNEAKFRSFFNKSNARILVVDPKEYKIIEANESALDFYGYTISELLNLDIRNEFIGLYEAIKVEISDVSDANKNIYTQRHKLKNKEYRDVEIYPAKVKLDDKSLIYIIVQDVTQRKKAIEALKESESKKLALLKIIPDLILVLSSEGRFVDVYTDQPDRISILPQKILGKKINQVFPEDLSEQLDFHIKKAITDRKVQSFEYRYKRDLKNYVFEEIRIISTGDNEVLVIMRDNSDEKHTQHQLKKAMEEAEEANRVKSVFLANISHEIRTPINAIMGFSDLLASEIRNKSHLQNIKSIKSSSKSLLNLINDILDLSKIEAGQLTIKYHDVNLKSLLNELKNIFSLKVAEKGITYSTVISEIVPNIIRFDELRLRQILINLISNAIKFTDKGLVSVQVYVINKKIKNHTNFVDLKFDVEDTGLGIKPENQEVIFEAFKQQDDQDTRKYGGTGLGLTITKRLIKLLNGRIELRSAPGMGSVFSIYFTNVEVSKSLVIETKEKNKVRIGQYIFKPTTILIADDDKHNRDILKGIFKGSEIEFLLAENGKHAIKLIKQKKPVLALLDVKMPFVDGLDVAKFIKKNITYQDIITIGVSATPISYNSDIRTIYLDDFVSKPINIGLLLKKLTKFLDVKKTSREPSGKKQPVDVDANVPDKSLIAGFLKAYKQEIEPAYIRMSNTSSFVDYDKFGKIIEKIGVDLKIKRLSYIGNLITEAVKTFDLETLSKLVSDYKTLEKKYLMLKDE